MIFKGLHIELIRFMIRHGDSVDMQITMYKRLPRNVTDGE